MTSFAFIFGVTPLMMASGAGAEMRRSLGVAVFSGMLGVTLFGILLTPVFFYVIQGLGETRLLTDRVSRWIGSTTAAALLGGTTGFLIVNFGIQSLPTLIAAPAFLAAGAVKLHRRFRHETGNR
jgi:multidrug efflux pump